MKLLYVQCTIASNTVNQRGLFYWKSTTGTTKAAIEANNGIHCLRKRIEKFPLLKESGMAYNVKLTKGTLHYFRA